MAKTAKDSTAEAHTVYSTHAQGKTTHTVTHST
jgi:hypothetical protein